MAQLIQDSFTDTNGTTLSSHTGDSGVTYTRHSTFTTATITIEDNRAAKDTDAATAVYYADNITDPKFFAIEFTIIDKSDVSRSMGISVGMDTASDTAVVFRRQNATTWQLLTIIAGTPSGNLLSASETFSAEAQHTLKLRRIPETNDYECFVDNVSLGVVTIADAEFLGTGKIGIRATNSQGAGVGYHLDNLAVTVLSAPRALHRGRHFSLFDDDEVNRFEFWPAVTAGGQLFTHNLSGVLSPSALLLESVSKPILASVSPSAALVKTARSSVTGMLSPTGLVVEQTEKTFTGSDAPLGNLLKRANRTLAASVNSIGSLSEQIGKSLSAALSTSGAELSGVQKDFTAFISPQSLLSTLRFALVLVTGTVSPSGALTKRADNGFSGVASGLGVLSSRVERFLTGAVSPSAALAQIKIVLLSVAGSVSPSGALARVIERSFLALTVSAGSISKQTQRILGGVSNLTATLSSIKILILSLVGAIAPSGTELKSIHATVAGAFTGAGDVIRHLARALDGAVTPTSIVTSLKIVLLALAGSVLPSGLLGKDIGYQSWGELTPTGIISNAVAKAFSASLSLGGVATKQCLKLVAGILTTTGSVVTSLAVLLRIIKQPTSVKLSSNGKSEVSVSSGKSTVAVNSIQSDVSIDS